MRSLGEVPAVEFKQTGNDRRGAAILGGHEIPEVARQVVIGKCLQIHGI